MSKDEMLKKLNKLNIMKNSDIETLYTILDELNIKYKKTLCSKCRRDLLNIAKEEVGLIQDASTESDF